MRQNADMDTKRHIDGEPRGGAGIGRRALFGRALLAVGAVASLPVLSGCPGGQQGDDGDDEGEDDD